MALYITFVDLEKTSDNAYWTKLFNILKNIDIDFKNKRIFHKLYLIKKKTVLIRKASNIYGKEQKLKKKVRLVWSLSLTFFNVYIENLFLKIRKKN